MIRLLRPLFASSTVNARLFVASVFIHLLGLAPAFYVTLVFSRYTSNGLDATLITITSGALLAMVLEGFLKRVRRDMMNALVAREERLRVERVAKFMLHARLDALHALSPAERSEAVRGVEQIQATLTASNLLALLDAPFALLFWTVILLMAWPLGVISALLVFVTLLFTVFKGFQIRATTAAVQKSQSAVQAVIASADRVETVRIANAADLLRQRWAVAAGQARIWRFITSKQQEKLQGASQIAASLMSICVIGIGAKLATVGMLDLSALFGASLLAGRMLGLVTRPVHIIMQLLQAQQSQASIDKLLSLELEAEKGLELPSFSGRWEFRDIAFTYPGQPAPLFDHLSVTIEPAQLVVITGSNGTGKTTFARMLVGLLQPTQGQILIERVDMRQFSPSWWRQQVVYVPQEPEFFDGTLLENLRTLSPCISEDELKERLRQVGLINIIDQHPLGLKIPVTMGGRNFSLGIRRRLALARALTTRGQLVVIDEPAEGLDAQGVQAMNTIMTSLGKEGRTLVLCMQQPAPEICRMATLIDLNPKPTPTITPPDFVSAKPVGVVS